ncbi:MAG: ABC transporter ATP-binding protein [Ruminococcaceae bacterium]|jgi:lipoprotein-releasing system ATP-binding protein|nr:ABC transporter ATP-binding protein [Oscillospiraceae bacterium]
MDKAIELSGINKIYGTEIKTQVLYDVNLSFNEQSFNAIIGQSGSGKSTLLNIMGTLDRPTSGTITISGRQTDHMNRDQLAVLRNETIGFIFQFHYLLPEFTALENVLMPYLIKHNKADKKVTARAEELMDMVGLSKVKNNKATNMSGGQQQRTAIARSLIMNPRIILADEPTGNLDSDTTEVIYDIMRDINKKLKTTFIIITHDRKVAEKTDRIVEIKDGRISLDVTRS